MNLKPYLLLKNDPKHRQTRYNGLVTNKEHSGKSPNILKKHNFKLDISKAISYLLIGLVMAIAFYITFILLGSKTVEGDVKSTQAQAIGLPVIAQPPEAPQPAPIIEPVIVPPVVETPAVEPVVAPVYAPVSDNYAKNFIYQHESGNSTTAVNSIGCRGLGQACPGSKLPCGDDYACQDAWFTNYALTRYGSWENAYSFWLNNHWW